MTEILWSLGKNESVKPSLEVDDLQWAMKEAHKKSQHVSTAEKGLRSGFHVGMHYVAMTEILWSLGKNESAKPWLEVGDLQWAMEEARRKCQHVSTAEKGFSSGFHAGVHYVHYVAMTEVLWSLGKNESVKP